MPRVREHMLPIIANCLGKLHIYELEPDAPVAVQGLDSCPKP